MKNNKSYKGVYISLIVISVIAIIAISAFALSGLFYPANTFYKNLKIKLSERKRAKLVCSY